MSTDNRILIHSKALESQIEQHEDDYNYEPLDGVVDMIIPCSVPEDEEEETASVVDRSIQMAYDAKEYDPSALIFYAFSTNGRYLYYVYGRDEQDAIARFNASVQDAEARGALDRDDDDDDEESYENEYVDEDDEDEDEDYD